MTTETKYKVQKSYFMGYGSDNRTIAEYDNPEKALEHIKDNPPPDESDGWVILGPDNQWWASTQYCGELIHVSGEAINSNYAKKDWAAHKQREKELWEEWKQEHPNESPKSRCAYCTRYTNNTDYAHGPVCDRCVKEQEQNEQG